MPRLIVLAGSDQGREFPIGAETATIGRHPGNEVVLNDNSVSRAHAQVVRRGAEFYIRDMGSTHGTFVNDVRNNAVFLLSDNDTIRVGSTTFVFRAGEEPQGPMHNPRPAPSRLPGLPLSSETIVFSVPAESTRAERALSGERLEMLTRVASAMQSVLDLDELLTSLVDALFEVLSPDQGAILLRQEPEGVLRPRVSRPPEGELKISQTIIDHALQHRISLLVSDAAGDERFSGAESIVAHSILSAICAPLICRDKALGVLYIDSKSPFVRFQKEDLDLLNIIAAEAAVAIDNALLVQQKLEAERLAAIGVAIAGMAHYVKNVLFGIKGSSTLIEEALETQKYDVVKKMWPVLQRSNLKISSLVQDMLSYSKKREPDWEPGNLNILLLDVYENQSARASEARVKLLLDLEENLPQSQFDHKAIHDTVLNIVGNAIEACQGRPGAEVSLRTRLLAAEQKIHLLIADNGPGIPEECQKKIFEPFFSTKGSKGTGLRLAVARKSVDEHGGKLLLESAPDKGATFKILLPIEPAPPFGVSGSPNDTATGE